MGRILVLRPRTARKQLLIAATISPPSSDGGLVKALIAIAYGINTVSTTWITPLDWNTSAIVTLETPPFSSFSSMPLPSGEVAVSFSPSTVVKVAVPLPALIAFIKSLLDILPATTWYVSTLVSVSLFSGLTKLSTVPAGNLSNASFVGANTVNGPVPDNVSTRPAAFTALTSVVWSLELTAFWTMFFFGDMGAPPTVGSFASAEPMLSTERAATAKKRFIRFTSKEC